MHKLKSMIEERRAILSKTSSQGEQPPNDYLTWVMEAASSDFDHRDEGIATRMLQINFAALHTTTIAFTHVLYYVAANPEYQEVLRAEAKKVLEEEGWSRSAIQKMASLDSIFRESGRLNPLNYAGLARKVQKDTRFSDGTTVAKGSFVAVALDAIHRNPEVYVDPDVFNPWRFVTTADDDADHPKSHLPHVSNSYLYFGGGEHACPGRFFAAMELKTMLCYLVMNYDVKMKNAGVRPPNISLGPGNALPCNKAEVMLRKRSNVGDRF